MSDRKKKSKASVDPEMLENLDMLLDYEILESAENWELIESAEEIPGNELEGGTQ